MHGFVRKIQEERFLSLLLFKPINRVVGEEIGDVARLLELPPVLVEDRVEVAALAVEAEPVVEAVVAGMGGAGFSDGAEVRSTSVNTPAWTYALADQQADGE